MFFLSDMLNRKLHLPKPSEALPGRAKAVPTASKHHVLKRPLKGPYPDGLETAMFGLGCFWGAERLFWQIEGVWVTAVGYAGGITPNPTYQETCTGLTGHAEVVLVVFDPRIDLLRRTSAAVLGKPRPDARHAPGQRCRHHLPLRDLHARAMRNIQAAMRLARCLRSLAARRRPWQDHHRDRAGAGLLLRRGRSPAISG